MSLARVKVWNPGDVLTAADLNAEFNNILNQPISLISPTTGVITFTTNQTFPANQLSGGLPAGSRVLGLNGTLSSQSGTFTANQYLLQTTAGTGSFLLNSTASFVVSIGTAGPAAGGRDVAAAFASTYIHWYAISTGLGSTALAGIVSTVPPPTGPTMPANYSAWSYLGGSAYTSASTTVLGAHRFKGASALYEASPVILTAGAATSETFVTVSSVVPNNAPTYIIGFNGSMVFNSAGDGSGTLDLGYIAGSTYARVANILTGLGAAHNYPFAVADITFPNVSSSGFFYAFTTGPATLQGFVRSYRMSNGDV